MSAPAEQLIERSMKQARGTTFGNRAGRLANEQALLGTLRDMERSLATGDAWLAAHPGRREHEDRWLALLVGYQTACDTAGVTGGSGRRKAP